MKIGFKRLPPTPVRIGFKRVHRNSSLWSAIVDRDYNAKPNNMDGSCAARAIPPGDTPSLLKTMGFKDDVGAQEYCDLMDAYRDGKFPRQGGYQTYRAARGQVGRIGHVAYSWKTWRD